VLKLDKKIILNLIMDTEVRKSDTKDVDNFDKSYE